MDETFGPRRFIRHERGFGLDDFQTGLVALLPRLRRFAGVLRSRDADAQDLVQKTVERAIVSRAKFRPGTRLDSWAFTIMRRLAIDDARSTLRWRKVLASGDEGVDHVPDPTQTNEDVRADALTVRKAIQGLPDDQKQAVALVLIEGLSYAEAATVLGVPPGTLTSRLVRGRQALIETLSAQGVTG